MAPFRCRVVADMDPAGKRKTLRRGRRGMCRTFPGGVGGGGGGGGVCVWGGGVCVGGGGVAVAGAEVGSRPLLVQFSLCLIDLCYTRNLYILH